MTGSTRTLARLASAILLWAILAVAMREDSDRRENVYALIFDDPNILMWKN